MIDVGFRAVLARRFDPVLDSPLFGNGYDYLTETVAELTMALILALVRRIAEGDRLIRSRQGWIWAPNLLLGRGLASLVLITIALRAK